MRLIGKKESKRKTTRVVATGKRVKGTWIMESLLSPKSGRGRSGSGVLVGENRRVRTLH